MKSVMAILLRKQATLCDKNSYSTTVHEMPALIDTLHCV